MWHNRSRQGIECHQFCERFGLWGMFSRFNIRIFMSGLEKARQFVVRTME